MAAMVPHIGVPVSRRLTRAAAQQTNPVPSQIVSSRQQPHIFRGECPRLENRVSSSNRQRSGECINGSSSKFEVVV